MINLYNSYDQLISRNERIRKNKNILYNYQRQKKQAKTKENFSIRSNTRSFILSSLSRPSIPIQHNTKNENRK